MDLYWIWRGSGERKRAAVRCLSCRSRRNGKPGWSWGNLGDLGDLEYAVLDRVWYGYFRVGVSGAGGKKRGRTRAEVRDSA